MTSLRIFLDSPEDRWSAFLLSQPWSSFLQSWPMGEVYRSIGQEPVRIAVEEDGAIIALCLAIEVPARRGKHLMVQYGPVMKCEKCDQYDQCEKFENDDLGKFGSGLQSARGIYSAKSIQKYQEVLQLIVEALKEEAKRRGCAFVRMSPFWNAEMVEYENSKITLQSSGFRPSPLHLLAEHIWYLDLGKIQRDEDTKEQRDEDTKAIEERILMGMRQTTRNLIRRAEKEGVTVAASDDPVRDLSIFFSLYEETCRRHHFVPYSREFIEAQVKEFVGHEISDVREQKSESRQQNGCSLYIARYNNEPVSASVHMHYGKETSYHHGASTLKYPKCFASYLLQWTAIKDAIARGDRMYNFWGVAPVEANVINGKNVINVINEKHPFAGVTTFKTGFGGELLNLVHCMDLPVSSRYWFTRWFEQCRKWKRGF